MPTDAEIIAKYFEAKAAMSKLEKGKDEMSYVAECKPGFKFGCDPELFVKNAEGVYVTAAGLIPGTKENPYPVTDGAVQVDGMAAEFNIDPCENFKDFNGKISSVMSQLTKMLPTGYTLDAVPSVVFSPEQFDGAPDEAKVLGCTPDFNAWTGDMNPPPHDPDNPYLRTASGHIHFGWTEDADLTDNQHLMNCTDLVKQLDWFLGGWSVKMDSDPTRRSLYGRAGACRFKPYGVEYRVLSNFWITTRDRRLAVWNRMQAAIEAMRKNPVFEKLASYNANLQNAINTAKIEDLAGSFPYPLTTLDNMRQRF